MAVALVGVAAPAHAATTVTIPKHRSDFSTIVLRGASESGFLAEQGPYPTSRALVGAPGTALTAVDSAWGGADAKGDYAWFSQGDAPNFTVRRLDLRTKAVTRYPASFYPLAFTPDGWLSNENGTLKRHVAGGATTTLLTGIDTSQDQPSATADANGAAVLYTTLEGGVRDRHIGLITFGKAGVEVVWSQSQGAAYKLELNEVSLTPTAVTWTTLTNFNGGGSFVHQRPRAGGAITTTPLPEDVSIFSWTAAGDAVAFRVITDNYYSDSAPVKVLSGGAWHSVALPGPSALLRSSGTRFYTGVTGKNTVAGVYGFGATGAASRVASPTAAPALLTGVALSAGNLTYVDDAVSGLLNTGSLWRRPATGSKSVSLGTEKRLAPPLLGGSTVYDDAPFEFSAARGVIRKPSRDYSPQTPYQLLDRGVVTRTLPQVEPFYDTVHVSGPYASVAGKIFRADGTLATDLTPEANNGALALFGRRVVYRSNGKVMLRDAEKPSAAPKTLASSGICDQFGSCAHGLAAWADRVAWERLDHKIAIRTLSTGATRVVDPGQAWAWSLQLSDLALTWGNGDDTYLLDLASATSKPVRVAGVKAATADAHLMAGITVATNRVRVRTLPFGSTRKTPVRLIGTLAPAAFTPGTWAPQFDLTKPATKVKLVIRSGPTVIRTLTGTAPDGSIRDLTWNGKNTAGTLVAAGVYTYRLSATARDGEGALTPVKGSVRVN